MRILIPMVIVLSLSVAGAQICNYAWPSSAISEDNRIILEDASEILMPSISLATLDGNWSYPFDCYPVYSQNHTIKGTFFGSNIEESYAVAAALARLNTSSFLETSKELIGPAHLDRIEIAGVVPLSINSTGIGHFAFAGVPKGLYILIIANLSNLSVMSALLILVAEENISIDCPDKLSPGDALNVEIRALNGTENVSRKYGAALNGRKGL